MSNNSRKQRIACIGNIVRSFGAYLLGCFGRKLVLEMTIDNTLGHLSLGFQQESNAVGARVFIGVGFGVGEICQNCRAVGYSTVLREIPGGWACQMNNQSASEVRWWTMNNEEGELTGCETKLGVARGGEFESQWLYLRVEQGKVMDTETVIAVFGRESSGQDLLRELESQGEMSRGVKGLTHDFVVGTMKSQGEEGVYCDKK
ncbi:hypothetical protein SISSUDRAFT_1037863 [Sistotremastrum suecicum HHB10207 ss-3]|uniref:Uncharacterized protein n=1 Tax=Sistotremastrum suecicum HHB10207 ss-3 TaxID=1314776 RepID=A0A165XJJ7_9AGAM|nr:hypothetical protein SISSUDRAFT_1037863 [Sistotremastrum suecicum HHB10207 ss-3]